MKAKLLLLFLLTNENIGLTGAYELPDSYLSFFTGLSQKDVEECKKMLAEKVIFEEGWIVLLNAQKHNNYVSNEKQKMAYKREYELLPENIKKYVVTLEAAPYASEYKKTNGQYIHRKIAEHALGRALREDEVIHHIDKNPANNSPANLAILSVEDHKALHSNKVSADGISMILVSDLYDTRPNTESRKQKAESRTYKSEILNKNTEFVDELKKQFPNKDVEYEIDKMNDFLSSTGKQYKDYKAFARNWMRRVRDDTTKAVVIR